MRHCIRTIALLCIVFFLHCAHASAWDPAHRRVFRQARELFDHGMYDQARVAFVQLAEEGDLKAGGWATLCCTYSRTPGYEHVIETYCNECSYSSLIPRTRFRYALNLFDDGRYSRALELFEAVDPSDLEKSERAEFMFKKAYCFYDIGDYDQALYGFGRVLMITHNRYTAPSQYMVGYIHYQHNRFKTALGYFESSAADPELAGISSYYIVECRFMLKDYAYVTREGPKVYSELTGDRKERLARMISEAYLIEGDSGNAAEYYGTISTRTSQSREDRFFAGSLCYANGDWRGAVDNFGSIFDRSDSLGQIANYQMGYSYIQLRNKVAALSCFKDAALLDDDDGQGVHHRGYDPKIREDAFYNYAKLSFDINHDGSAFKAYMDAYRDVARNDQIYSYIALAALYDHDYAAAVEAYNEIDELDDNMKENYKKANYLRANQLVLVGAWKDAIPFLKAASYYDSKYSTFNQLSRYWLAESYYRDGQHTEARKLYNELFNLSAMDGKPEGWLIPYHLAYCYYREEDYANASRWFSNYLDGSVTTYRRDALVRIADCLYLQGSFSDAAVAYRRVTREYSSLDDLYPHYQGGLAYGRAGDKTGKVDILSPVLNASPDAGYYSEALYELARSLVDIGRNDDARDGYNLLVNTSPDRSYAAMGLLGLGVLEGSLGKYDTAIAHYKRVVAEMPGTEWAESALMGIESAYAKLQQPEAYLAYLESMKGRIAERSESDIEAMLFASAEQIYLSGNFEKAVSTLRLYEEKYPQGSYLPDAWFYMGECYVALDRKDEAIACYKKVMYSNDGNFQEQAALSFAILSYDMGRYVDAYSAYDTLHKIARLEANRHTARVGMMNSAYKSKDYVQAKYSADIVLSDSSSDADERRQASLVKGKSLLSMSLREEALAVLAGIAGQTSTPEGAEAAYMLIQDSYDQGLFEEVEEKVYAFSSSGSNQSYWLAKAFILLGDSFAERDELVRAKATFESVRDGYKVSDGRDEISDAVEMRLRKIARMTEDSL